MNRNPERPDAGARPPHWRSLEQLASDPRALEFLEREFPEGAAELPEGMTRRTMLTLVGASLSLAGLAGCRRPVEKIVPYVTAPEESLPGVPRYYATTMPLGLTAHGLVVESHEGRPTKIEGNKQHPASLGATNAWQQASILGLYDPGRSQSVKQSGRPDSWAGFVAAWGALEANHLQDGGASLAILDQTFSSPTMARLTAAIRARFPNARQVAWEPVSDENILAGVRLAAGAAYRPDLRVARARVILALDSDFLMGESENVLNAGGFADGRRVANEHDEMNRLYAVEGVHTVTGANADHRLRLRSGQIGALTARLAGALGLAGGSTAAVPGVDESWIEAVAADLEAHRGESLIVAGNRQPAEVHAAVLALNAALGNVGTTVLYRDLPDQAISDLAGLSALTASMAAGQVTTLVVLGGNPIYDAPADLEFGSALGQVTTTIHLGLHENETSRAARWHLPQAHFLEAWGDARAFDGTRSVIQPLIEPLFGGKSSLELLGLMATGADGSGYDHVRESWKTPLGEVEFEKSWNRVLHDGLLAGSALPPTDVRVGALPAGLGGNPPAGDMELVFVASPAVFDGRFASNAWLQELPDPITKLTWDNAALISPATAEAHGIGNEEVVQATFDGRRIELPAWIVPGQADGVVAIALGYGRTDAGAIASGAGADAYALRTSKATGFGAGVTLAATGAKRPLAQTQDHGSMKEPDTPVRKGQVRPIVRQATLTDYRARPDFAQHMEEVPFEASPWKETTYEHGPQWGMTIDLNTCTGCNACVIACQSENNIPTVGREQVRNGREMHWIRMDRYFGGDEHDPEVVFQAVPCMQCENAPCEQVCPVAATVHNDEGLNVMVYNRCIGTRYCSNNCPYKVRRFNFFNYTKDTPEIVQLAQNPDVTVRSRGVMEKCTYCTQRINAAKIDAKIDGRPLADGEIQTACQQACPANAIEFGDIRDPASRVSETKRQERNYGLLEGLYTKPRTTYLAKLRNPNPRLAPAGGAPAAEPGHGGEG